MKKLISWYKKYLQLIWKHKLIFVIMILAFIGLAIIGSNASEKASIEVKSTTATTQPSNATKPKHTVVKPKKSKPAQKKTMSESDAEEVCQTEATIKLEGQNISIIDIWDYNEYYANVGYDESGYPLMQLTWNGKDKDTKSKVSFACVVSNSKEKNNIHYLAINGKALEYEATFKDGTPTYNSYDKSGKLVQ